jgi:hypothetical protein
LAWRSASNIVNLSNDLGLFSTISNSPFVLTAQPRASASVPTVAQNTFKTRRVHSQVFDELFAH